jgi:hypothetical protein
LTKLLLCKIRGFHGGDQVVFLSSVCRLLVTASHPDEGGATFLRNVGSYKSHTA